MEFGTGEVNCSFQCRVDKLGGPYASDGQHEDGPLDAAQSKPCAERNHADGSNGMNPGIGLRAEQVPYPAESMAKAGRAGLAAPVRRFAVSHDYASLTLIRTPSSRKMSACAVHILRLSRALAWS